MTGLETLNMALLLSASSFPWSCLNWKTTVLFDTTIARLRAIEQHAERHDEGWNAQIGHDDALEQADQQRDGERRAGMPTANAVAGLHGVTPSTMLTRASTEPTLRSMPPVMITRVWPRAMMATKVKLRVMLKKFLLCEERVGRERQEHARGENGDEDPDRSGAKSSRLTGCGGGG